MGVSKTSGSSTIQDEDTGDKAAVNTKSNGEFGLEVIAEVSDIDLNSLLAGDAYCISMEYVLNSGQTVYQSFTTPNNSDLIKMQFKTQSMGRSEIQVWEAPTGVTYSFSWTPRNRNRNSSNTSNATVQAVNTQTTLGTFICKESNYGSGQTVTASPINNSRVYVLKPNTEYLFAMKSFDASNLTYLNLEWIES